ncbi:hypothetical protein E2562_000446, partial [Oryza meyeriana var. granulata]
DWYFYFASKTLAEREAFAYAAKTGMDIVTICPALVIGPLMQPTVPTSIKVFFDTIKGDGETVGNKLETILDVRDVARALLLAYENSEASGRYICSSTPRELCDIVNMSKSLYPNFTYPK